MRATAARIAAHGAGAHLKCQRDRAAEAPRQRSIHPHPPLLDRPRAVIRPSGLRERALALRAPAQLPRPHRREVEAAHRELHGAGGGGRGGRGAQHGPPRLGVLFSTGGKDDAVAGLHVFQAVDHHRATANALHPVTATCRCLSGERSKTGRCC